MTFPVLAAATGSFIVEDAPLRPTQLRFLDRVFLLHRIVQADHLGPTEAEYREVER
jgi:hypothetical protein